MAKDLSQAQLIKVLTAYLNSANLPIQINYAGICNGLAILHAKYILEGKSAEFIDMLGYISEKKVSSGVEQDAKINEFVTQLVLSFSPKKYYKSLNQNRSHEVQLIDGKPLKSIFHLPLVTTDGCWSEIFEKLNLHEDEVIVISSMDHAITVRKNGSRYTIYDPNYGEAEKSFSTAEELVYELHQNCFEYNSEEMALIVHVMTHPNKNPRATIPNPKDIYQHYLTAENINKIAKMGPLETNTMQLAAGLNDAGLIQVLLSLGVDANNIYLSASRAAYENNPDVLAELLPLLSVDENEIILISILRSGRQEALDAFLQIPVSKQAYDGLLNELKFVHILINFAAEGGNGVLLQRIITEYKNNHLLTDIDIASKILIKNKYKIDSIESAITSTEPECLRVLLQALNTAGTPLNDEQKLHYMRLAIKQNQPLMVDVLLEIMPPELIQRIKLSLPTVQKTCLILLKALQNGGMEFSEHAQAIIAKKEHQSIGLLLAIGIALIKFTDFCKEKFLNRDGVSFTFFQPEPATNPEPAPAADPEPGPTETTSP